MNSSLAAWAMRKHSMTSLMKLNDMQFVAHYGKSPK